MGTAVTRWIRKNANPLTTFDPHAPLADLRPLCDIARNAQVVALGASTRQSHEMSVIAHRILRLLVEELGFRSLALEGDDATSIHLDEYVRTGTGEPRALLADARSFWRTGEILDVVAWMRAYNQRNPADPVGFVRAPDHSWEVPLGGLDEIERRLAENTIRWHERTGDKIVYWGGIAHTVNGDPRTISPSSPHGTHRNAGSYLRERFGAAYLSVGMTFGHGSLPYPVPVPPEEFAEATFGDVGIDAFVLDLGADREEQVLAWLESPARTRLIGPEYDPEDDAAYHLSGGALAEWFDVVVHCREVTPVRLLS